MKISSFVDVGKALFEMAKAQIKIKAAEAEMNDEINAIKKKYDTRTAAARELVTVLSGDIETYCKLNKAEFEKTRSKEFSAGTIGFRNTPPKVVAFAKKFTIAVILGNLKNQRPEYVRTKEEIDKESILGAYAAKNIDDEQLKALGLKVDNDDQFFINLKEELLTNE
jgi:phage host-nuclease inhibitor protein Gam